MMMKPILVELGKYPGHYYFCYYYFIRGHYPTIFLSEPDFKTHEGIFFTQSFQEIQFSQHIFTEEDAWLHLSHQFDLLKTSEARKMFNSHSSFFVRKREISLSPTQIFWFLIYHIMENCIFISKVRRDEEFL